LITNVILNEINLLATHLPTNEPPFAFGQWGPIVSSLLIVIATIINEGLEIQERRKNAADIPRDDSAVVPVAREDPVELEGQTSGVVSWSVGRQETLKDTEQILASSRK
jgi:hypothetical protein